MINQFKDDYTKLITDFSVIDENDPITLEKLNQISNILDTKCNEFEKMKSDIKKKRTNFDKKNNHTTKKFNKKIENIESIYLEKLALNKENHTISCNKLKDKLEQFKIDSEYDIQQLEINHEFFSSSVEQSKLILLDDFSKNKKRYDYQLNEAKLTYYDIVSKKNIELENQLTTINNNYINKSLKLKKETVNSTLKIQEKITENEKEFNSFSKLILNENNSLKEKYRKESTLLNEDIKKLISEKNKNLDNTRNEYIQTINNLNIEKENKKENLHNKSQAILKEFVTKINEIDEESANIKTKYEQIILNIKRDYYETIYKKTKEFHTEIENLYSSSDNKKHIQKNLKFLNRQYNSAVKFIKKDVEYKLLELSKDCTIKLAKNKTNKTLLELDKNYNIKALTDEEQYNNKYYQEKSNIYENDYNLYVKNINIKFNQSANDIKLRSEKRTKLLERNHLGIDINYSKRIETINNNINKLKFELSFEKDLEKINTIYEENKYINNINLTKATNLLEIEKNKLLKDYNISRYKNHINELELDKRYGLKKLEIETEHKDIIKNYQIKNVKLLLEKNILTSSYAIKKEQIYENFNKEKINLVKNNSYLLAQEKYINTLKENNLFYLNLLKEYCNTFLKNFYSTYYDTTQLIINDIELTPSNCKYIQSFISLYTKQFMNLLNEFNNHLSSLIIDTANEKIAFIHEFKYKSQFDELKQKNSDAQKIAKKNKEDIEKKIDLNQKTIENVKNKIFTLINDKAMIEGNIKYKKSELLPEESKSLTDNELKTKDYKEKIENYQKLNKILYVDLNENAKFIRSKLLEYKNLRKIIQNKKYFDTKIFINFKADTKKVFSDIRTNIFKFESIKPESNPKNLNFLNKNYSKIESIILYIDKKLSILLQTYEDKINKENAVRNNINKKNHQKDIKSYNEKLNAELDNYQKEYDYALKKQNLLIEENQYNINESNQYFEKLLVEASENYKLEYKNNNYFFEVVTNEFYENYYSLNDNNENIVNYHKSLYNQNEYDYKNKISILRKNKNNLCLKGDEKLKQLINEKNSSIQNLPIIYKNTSKLLEKNVKKMNIKLNKDLKEIKANHYIERKNLDKVINNFKNQLDYSIAENSFNLEKNIKTEEKNSLMSLNQNLKSIKINL